MLHFQTRRSVLAVGALFAAAVVAGLAQGQSKAPDSPLFLTDADLDLATHLASPPSQASAEEKRELLEVHRIQAAASPERMAKAEWDEVHEDGGVFAETFGPGFSSLPATSKLLADVRHDQKLATSKAKAFYRRTRPWIVDPTLKPCSTDDKPLTSYPSGHATMGYAMAVVLAAAAPAKRRALTQRADGYAENRLVCGMHFRSDLVGGKTLGEGIGRAMLAKPAFRAELAAAAKELNSLR